MFFKKAEGEEDGQEEETQEPTSGSSVEKGGNVNCSLVIRKMWAALREAYGSAQVVCWSIWWALATAGYTQVFNYVQLMWDHVEPSSSAAIYNGGVEAVCTLVGERRGWGWWDGQR